MGVILLALMGIQFTGFAEKNLNALYLYKGDRRRRPFYIQQKCTGARRDGHSSHF